MPRTQQTIEDPRLNRPGVLSILQNSNIAISSPNQIVLGALPIQGAVVTSGVRAEGTPFVAQRWGG